MNAIEWIDTQISGLEIEIGVLKMQRKVLIDASKERKLDELEAALAPKATIDELEAALASGTGNGKVWGGNVTISRKPRTSGVKDAVLSIMGDTPSGLRSVDIINALPHLESGSIRQALNGLKKKGEVIQDGKMWMMAPGGVSNGAYAAEEMTA